ncbi:MAG: MMPL family transporter, partial [Pseudomonadota bacterium]
RARLLTAFAIAGVLIASLLALVSRSSRRTLWLLGTVTAAMALSTAAAQLLGRGLSLFDLVSLALVAGLGLDYALFYSAAARGAREARAFAQAVTLCAASSLLVFGILSLSSVPLLRGIGLTVATGVLGAYLLARLGRYPAAATEGTSDANPST